MHPTFGITGLSTKSPTQMSLLDMHAQPSQSCSNHAFRCDQGQQDCILCVYKLQNKSHLAG